MRIKEFRDNSKQWPSTLIVRRYAKKLGYRYEVHDCEWNKLYIGNDKDKAILAYNN